MSNLEKQRRMEFSTGITTDVEVRHGISIANYFRSLNILNVAAPLYGCVYLASEEALSLLESLEEKEKA